MLRSHRITLVSVCALVASSAVALAQTHPPDVECKKTETQAECHARLKCKKNEELEDCQKRLLKCKADEKLDDCKKRVAEGNAGQPAKEGNAGDRNAEKRGGDRNADETARQREADKQAAERRDRENADKERERQNRENADRERERQNRENADRERERQNRDERAQPRRQRGEREGDNGDRRRGGRGGGGGGGKGFEANKTFGLGLEVGEPTGLNGKLFLSKSGALDFGVGWIYRHYYYREGEGFHAYADYLWHPVSLVSAAAFELPFYIGVGLRFWDFHYCINRVCDYRGSAIGIRVPVGIAFDFNNVPLDIFIQVVPVLDFLNGDYADRYGDRAHFGLDFSAGIRYWFK